MIFFLFFFNFYLFNNNDLIISVIDYDTKFMKTKKMKYPFINKAIIIYLFIGLFILNSCVNKKENIITQNEDVAYSKILKNILDNTKEPQFKNSKYNILDFGAIADGKTICTTSFEKAIKKCTENGGGIVLVPKGKFLTGPIHLENNINLHLEDGAEILFSTNPDDYYPLVHTSFEGIELMNYSPLIYAYKKSNIKSRQRFLYSFSRNRYSCHF